MAMDIDNLIRTKTESPAIWVSTGTGGGGGGVGVPWITTGTGGTPPNTGVGAQGAQYDPRGVLQPEPPTDWAKTKGLPFSAAEEFVIRLTKASAKELCADLDFTRQMFRGMQPKYILAGGCFASMFHKERPKDYDIFFLGCDENTTVGEKLNTNELTFSQTRTDKQLFYLKNPNITTIVDHTIGDIDYQFIFTKYKTRQELIAHFDFLHACVSYVPHDDKLYITRCTYDAIKDKKLIPNPTAPYPEVWRFDKFLKKGWITDETFSL